jgi:hypothetical protein
VRVFGVRVFGFAHIANNPFAYSSAEGPAVAAMITRDLRAGCTIEHGPDHGAADDAGLVVDPGSQTLRPVAPACVAVAALQLAYRHVAEEDRLIVVEHGGGPVPSPIAPDS